MANKTIFSAQTTNGNSDTFISAGSLNSSAIIYSELTIYGTFDGASIELQYKAADGQWYPTGDYAIIAPCKYLIEPTTAPTEYRLVLSGAGASTSISSTVYNVT